VWPLLQFFPEFGQILLPFRRFAALALLGIDPLNRRMESQLRRFQVPAARGDVRMIQERLHRVEIGTTLQQSTAGFSPRSWMWRFIFASCSRQQRALTLCQRRTTWTLGARGVGDDLSDRHCPTRSRRVFVT
jgi:hypothetical protein